MQGKTKARRTLRIQPTASKSGLAPSTIRQKVREGTFPAPVVLAVDKQGRPCQVAWYEDEVDAWLASRPRHSATLAAACKATYADAFQKAREQFAHLGDDKEIDKRAREVARRETDAALSTFAGGDT